MSNMKGYKISLDMEADRLLGLVRSDLLLMGHGHIESLEFRRAIGTNLRALAGILEAGGTPDPFPMFRHGQEVRNEESLMDELNAMYAENKRLTAEIRPLTETEHGDERGGV